MIAMMLELRHGKRAILEAYLNEIYLGRSGTGQPDRLRGRRPRLLRHATPPSCRWPRRRRWPG